MALAFAVLHFAALVGIYRGRDWGRNLAVFVAELGGGLAILGAISLLTGARPFGADSATGLGLIAWAAGVYALLGIAAGRIPVLARLTPIERRRVVFGPSFAGRARPLTCGGRAPRRGRAAANPRLGGMTDEPTLYDAAGGMPFFEALVGRFYEGVATDPVLAAALSRRRTSAGARHRLTLFLAQYWGGPRPTTPSAAIRACGCATCRSRSDRPSATPGCARMREAIAGPLRRPRSPTGSTPTSTWPPRRCATATDGSRRGSVAAAPARPGRVDWAADERRRADWRTARPRRSRIHRSDGAAPPPPPDAQRGKTVHGEPANAGHRVLAPDDAEVEAYLETALNAPAPTRRPRSRSARRRRARLGRRPRLRQPVRPADRPPRPGAARLLRAASRTTRRGPRSSGAGRRRSSSRAARTRSTTTDAPKPDAGVWSRPDPGPRHLLRRPADGQRARRRRRRRRRSGSTARPPSRSPTATASSRASIATSPSG